MPSNFEGHTEDPWDAEAQYTSEGFVPLHPTKIVRVIMATHLGDVAYVANGIWSDEEIDANARLLAAAPRFFKALKKIAAKDRGDAECLEIAREALGE